MGCTAAPSPLRLVYATPSGHNPPLTPQAAGAGAAAGAAGTHSFSLPLQRVRPPWTQNIRDRSQGCCTPPG
eukprot:1963970-Prymnesium_polylepis.1